MTQIYPTNVLQIQDRRRRSQPLEEIFDDDLTSFSRNLASKGQTVNNLLSEYMVLIARIRTNLLELLKRPRTPSTNRKVLLLLRECRDLDSAISSWPDCIPLEWKYRSIVPKDSPSSADTNLDLCPDVPVDIYCNPWSACAWNNYRCTRLFLNAFVIRCIANLAQAEQLPENSQTLQNEATRRMQEMVDGICSSIPFHIGYFPPEPLKASNVPRMKPVDPIVLAAYFLLWPIFVARSAMTVPMKQREWLRARMVEMSKRFGNHHAMALAQIGDTDPARPLYASHWDVSYFENLFESCNLYAAGGV